jgi:hypothetical protein
MMAHSFTKRRVESIDQALDVMVESLSKEVEDSGVAMVMLQKAMDEPLYVATVGLSKLGCPDVVFAGFPVAVAPAVVTRLHALAAKGAKFLAGERSHDVLEQQVMFKSVESGFGDVAFRSAERVCGPVVGRVQMLWPDSSGRFPGEEGCDEIAVRRQPSDTWNDDVSTVPLKDEDPHARLLRNMSRPRRLN